MRKVLITGCAGFIGFHLSQRLLRQGDSSVIGLDNLNDYYDVSLKEARLARLTSKPDFRFYNIDLCDRAALPGLFREHRFDQVVNLAAQAGVRYSITNPESYVDSNLVGFGNVLEGCRHNAVKHLLFASSSSVYGGNIHLPFSVEDVTDSPMSLYAATKKANELMAHAYSHLYRLPCTGLRFFTVYGPWGRPDMALFLFTKAILEGRPIDVYNDGKMSRDFTYIDDIVEGMVRVMQKAPQENRTTKKSEQGSTTAPYRIYNIGNSQPVKLMTFVALLEQKLGKKAQLNLLPMQAGDIPETYAGIDDLVADFGFKPETSIEDGISRFVDWYREYYRL